MKDSGLFISERYLYAHRLIGEGKFDGLNSEYLASEIGLKDLTLQNWGQNAPPDQENDNHKRSSK